LSFLFLSFTNFSLFIHHGVLLALLIAPSITPLNDLFHPLSFHIPHDPSICLSSFHVFFSFHLTSSLPSPPLPSIQGNVGTISLDTAAGAQALQTLAVGVPARDRERESMSSQGTYSTISSSLSLAFDSHGVPQAVTSAQLSNMQMNNHTSSSVSSITGMQVQYNAVRIVRTSSTCHDTSSTARSFIFLLFTRPFHPSHTPPSSLILLLPSPPPSLSVLYHLNHPPLSLPPSSSPL
jgi:hypothetical protein